MLKDQLLVPARRGAVIADCVTLIEDQVAAKGGLSGLAIKGAYAVVKAVKPGFVRDAVDHLLDEFVARLEPFHEAALAAKQDVAAYFAGHPAEIANGLLGVTDARAERARNPTVKKAYERLRPTAQKHVETAVPAVGKLVARHVATTAVA
jgi:hypothetical protein